VLSFPSPETALFFLQLNPDMDLLILDYNLKVFTAAHFMERVKQKLPSHCKVILISGHTDIVENLDIAELGADVFLPKPLDLNLLLQEIESIEMGHKY
jgi:DNA-binding response OmpR family regulator